MASRMTEAIATSTAPRIRAAQRGHLIPSVRWGPPRGERSADPVASDRGQRFGGERGRLTPPLPRPLTREEPRRTRRTPSEAAVGSASPASMWIGTDRLAGQMERREGAPRFGAGREVGGDGGGRGGEGLEPFAIGPPGERRPCGPVGAPGVRGEGIGGGGPDAFHMGLHGRLTPRGWPGHVRAVSAPGDAYRCPLV